MHHSRYYAIVFCILLQTCSASKEERRLLSTLLDPVNYDRHVRPVIDHRKPVVVDVRLALVEIIGLDETSGRLTLKLHLNLSWRDEYLMWTPGNYGDVQRLNVETSPTPKIWLPDIALFNAINTPAFGTSTGSVLPGGSATAVVQSHGRVRLVQPFIASVTARHEFRANAWIATLRLGSWSHDDAAMRLRSTGDRRLPTDAIDIDTDQFAAGDHWTLIGHSGQRVKTAVDGGNGLTDCCPPPAPANFVTFNYGLKLRKKTGPSLLAG